MTTFFSCLMKLLYEMDGKKVYQIQINGLKESTDAVEALNKVLGELENRIKTLESKSVKVGASTSGSGSKTSSLSEEAKLEKQIEQTDAKREAYSKKIYQNYLAAKDVLDETVKDQKAIAASERLQAKNYTNTMAGMKQELADLKTVMNGTDLGDEKFVEMSKRAGELTAKLKELEAQYGQFGRNVGNYQSAFDGLDKVHIKVGDTVREFGSAREAAKTLKNELTALELAEKSNTKEADELRSAYYRLKSAMDDATKSSKAMDAAMDTMQSITAMASIGNGLQAFFGFDDNEITRSIQKLVALQGVLNGLETLRKQMETSEGFGAIFGKSFKNVDKWTYSLMRTNVALRGTGTSARIAAAGIKVLNFAIKGLMTLGVAVALDLLVEGIQKLAGAVRDFVKGDADLISSSEVLENAIAAQNKVLEQNLDIIKKRVDAGDITTEQARVQVEKEYSRQIDETSKSLMKVVNALQMMGTLSNEVNLESVMGDKGVTWIGGFKEAINSIEDFNKRFDDLEERVSHNNSLSSWFSSASDARDELVHLTQLVGGDFMVAMKKFSDGTEEGTRALVDYIDKMDEITNGRYSRAMKLVKFDNEGLQKDIENAWAMIENLRDKVFKNPIVVKLELEAKIEGELDRLDPTRAIQRSVDEWKAILAKGVDEAGNVLSESQKNKIKKIIVEQQKNIDKQRQQRLETERNHAKKLAEEAERVEKELNQLRIENMKEGLAKTLAQLAEERRERLQQAKITGIRVGELTLEINKLYDKKELEARKEHAQEVQKVYQDMWEQIFRSYDTTFRMNLDSQLMNLDTELEKMKEKTTELFNPRYASYGGTQLDNRMSDDQRRKLGYNVLAKDKSSTSFEIDNAKEYLDLIEEIEARELELANLDTYFDIFGLNPEELEEKIEESKKKLADWANSLEMTQEEFQEMMESSVATQDLIQAGYTKSISTAMKIRLNEAKQYYEEVEALEKEHSEKVMQNELDLLNNEANTAKREEKERYDQQLAQLEESREKGLITEEKYNEILERAAQEHADALEAIGLKQVAESERIQQDHMNRLKQITAEGMRGMLNEYRDAFTNISKLQSRQPQMFSGALGDMGIINFGLTKKNYTEALKGYELLSRNILAQKEELQKKLDNNEITFDDFQQAKRELDGLSQDCADAAMDVQTNLENLGGEWWGSIDQWIQQAGQAITNILGSLSEITSNQYEEQISEQEKFIEKYKEMLDKQKEITQQHASAIDAIEEELATSRGDRRQHLIDQINAEMEAQRASLREEQRIEKEQEKAEKKKKKLEHDQAVAKKKMDLAQAAINAAMAVSMAAVNHWPIPAIPMMAMAAAVGAAQIAAVASQRIPTYGSGGVIEGKSHAQGGVKVLGGRAEVEGGEYITNKRTTAVNVDLLDYINSKHRKLNIDDFIDFYSSGNAKKNFLASSPRQKFADGGVIPTLNNEYQFDDRLISAFEDYSNRPVYVSVVDINNRQAAVKNVQVLAGLGE